MKRRFGFRARLTSIIAGTFFAAGLLLVVAQYVLIGTASTSVTLNMDENNPDVAELREFTSVAGVVLPLSSQQVLWVTLGSLLIALGGGSILIATWISRQMVERVGSITQTAQRISDGDLTQRLELDGPHDEIRELGDTFDAMLDRLQGAFERQTQFVSNASHELRTPLTVIRTSLEIPLVQEEVPEELRPAFDRALAAVNRSEGLIASLLQLAQGGSATERFEPVDLRAVCAAVIEESAPEAVERQVTVSFLDGPGDAVVDGSPALIEVMVRNLVENAIRHNHPGGVVEITIEGTESTARLIVENSGKIIEPGDVDNLIVPFSSKRTVDPGGYRGYGLGLSIVQSVASLHEGQLELAARKGGGLRVTLALPSSIAILSGGGVCGNDVVTDMQGRR